MEKLIKSNLFLRVLSSIILSSIFIYALIFNKILFLITTILIVFLSFFELSKIIMLDKQDVFKNLLLSLLFLFLFYISPSFFKIFIIFFFILVLPGVVIKNIESSAFYRFLPALYLPSFFASIVYLLNQNTIYLLVVFLGIWSVDIGGYFFGRLFGRNKLFPITSPKKTYEGLMGSFVLVILFLSILNFNLSLFNLPSLLLMSLLLLICSVFGDYFESHIKRKFNVKDSGKLIPGHGGVLDRVDSALFVVPIIYLIYDFV